MRDAAPAHVGDVEQAIEAVQIDERAEIGDVLHRALADVAGRHFSQQLRAALAAFLFNQFAARQHDVLPLLVDLHDFKVVIVTNENVQVLGGDDVDLRGGEKSFHADIDEQPAFDDGLDLAVDGAAFVADLKNLFPILLKLGLLLREHDHAFFVLELFDEDVDLVADFNGLDVFEFCSGNGSFTFVTDVHQHFFGSDFDDVAFDDFASRKARIALLHGLFHCQHK